jgi:CRP-like cAMP-binding protein
MERKPVNDTGIVRIKHILREIPFFEEFGDDDLDYFARQVSLRSFPKKTVLFREGDVGDYLFFVIEGSVDVRLETSDSNRKVIASYGWGSCVGEMSLVDDYPRSATIWVTKPSELLIMTKTRFEDICANNPHIGLKFMRGLARNLSIRLRGMTGKFSDLS